MHSDDCVAAINNREKRATAVHALY